MAKFITLDNLDRFKDNCDNGYMPKKEIDNIPTDNSENLITSGGVKEYVDNQITPHITIDEVPTEDSQNAVSSGGVKEYVDNAIADAISNSIVQALGGDY